MEKYLIKSIKEKIERLKNGDKPRVLDLFAGCGGISLGFNRAGFEITDFVEFDGHAAASHELNFPHPKGLVVGARDITKVEPNEISHELGYKDKEKAFDIIVGGPPCQSFARVGRAKLREVAEHPEAYLNDPRGNLYLRYIQYVRELKPLAVLMENVPDVLNYGGHNVAEETAEVLEALGYTAAYTLLNAVHFGVPEMRERMFLIAYRKELGIDVGFPEPTHKFSLPKGYEGTRAVALKTIENREKTYFSPPIIPGANVPDAISASQALSDLPVIKDHLLGTGKKGARRFTELVKYRSDPESNSFAWEMRNWPGFENEIGVSDHVIRHLPRDYKIFKKMKPGDQYPEAWTLANTLLEEELKRMRAEGKKVSQKSKAYEVLKKHFVPPYDPTKFPNKWRKMEPDSPSRTLMAHLGKDSYSHIHFDSNQARTISVREAARLQSFPDGFKFVGTMNPAFKQIGNAVPPFLSFRIAEVMMKSIEEGVKHAVFG